MLKITGGELRGRSIKTPPGLDTRPSGAKMRQALFNILGPRVAGARVADLFAGSGALGLEALSRGAAWCIFLEQDRRAAGLIRTNLEALGLMERGQVLPAPLAAAGGRLKAAGPFDLVLADPPYNRGLVKAALELVAGQGLLAAGGLLAIEHSPAETPTASKGLAVMDRRRYGQTQLSLLSASAARKGFQA